MKYFFDNICKYNILKLIKVTIIFFPLKLRFDPPISRGDVRFVYFRVVYFHVSCHEYQIQTRPVKDSFRVRVRSFCVRVRVVLCYV